MRDVTAKLLSRIHAAAYRLTAGLVGSRLVDNDMLLLTTTGRRTGEPHTVPLLYLEDDDRYVVFASWGGRDRHPEWYLNLVADPQGFVQVLGRRLPIGSTTALAGERERLWVRAVSAYPEYATYQTRTRREIPVVILDPGHEARGGGGSGRIDL